MIEILGAQFQKYDPHMIGTIRQGLANMAAACGGTVGVATGCSGSDLVFHILDKLKAFWVTTLGIEVHIQHLFSCEKEAWKREWILEHWRPQRMFGDICEFDHNSCCEDLLSRATCGCLDLWIRVRLCVREDCRGMCGVHQEVQASHNQFGEREKLGHGCPKGHWRRRAPCHPWEAHGSRE